VMGGVAGLCSLGGIFKGGPGAKGEPWMVV